MEKLSYLPYLFLRKTVLFIVAGFMCLGTFSAPARETPKNPNVNTGEYYLPDFSKPLISSHRSGKGAAPENTLRAVKSNLVYADTDSAIIEMDVQLTRDGEIVLYHSLFLDENSNSAEYFGRKNTCVFMKTYQQLRNLNLGENYKSGNQYPFRGLRGDDIPDDIRITRLSEVFSCIEKEAPGVFRYIVEVKYPHPWAPKIVDGIYDLLKQYNMADRVIVASFWPDVSSYIDRHYRGKINRSANPFEIVDLYGCYTRNDDLKNEDFKYVALQLPYYWKDGKLLVGNLGKAGFIDYAHKYRISMQYWTVDRTDDARYLASAGADLLMTNHPERLREALYPKVREALTNANIFLSAFSFTYNGTAQKPVVTVKNAAGDELTPGVDYTVSFANEASKAPGKYTVTVTAAGENYEGEVESVYTIGKQPLSAANITLSAERFIYNGKAQKPALTVRNAAGKKLTEGKHYTLTWSNESSKAPGKYTVTVTGKGTYFTGSVRKTYRIAKQPVTAGNITLSAATFSYNGAVQKPTVTVRNAAGKKLTEGKHYTLTWSNESSKAPGKYTVTVTGKGAYFTGTVTKTYKIRNAPGAAVR